MSHHGCTSKPGWRAGPPTSPRGLLRKKEKESTGARQERRVHFCPPWCCRERHDLRCNAERSSPGGAVPVAAVSLPWGVLRGWGHSAVTLTRAPLWGGRWVLVTPLLQGELGAWESLLCLRPRREGRQEEWSGPEFCSPKLRCSSGARLWKAAMLRARSKPSGTQGPQSQSWAQRTPRLLQLNWLPLTPEPIPGAAQAGAGLSWGLSHIWG